MTVFRGSVFLYSIFVLFWWKRGEGGRGV